MGIKRGGWKENYGKDIEAFSVLPFALDRSVGFRPAVGHGCCAAGNRSL